MFGEYVDVYDMIAAQEDGAVVPVSYESRIIELTFNEAERQALMEDLSRIPKRKMNPSNPKPLADIHV